MSFLRTTDAPRAVADIEDAVNSIVAWWMRNDVQQEAMRRARCDVPRASVWLLARVAKSGPVRAGDLACALGVDSSTLTPQTQRLEREGLIARSPDPRDGRAALFRLTPSGRGLLARLTRARRAMFDEILADWPDHERSGAAAVLGRLADSLSAPAAPSS